MVEMMQHPMKKKDRTENIIALQLTFDQVERQRTFYSVAFVVS